MTEYVTEVCRECGNLKSVCSVPSAWYPQRAVCFATAAREQTMRQVYAKHGTPDPKHSGEHFMDGTAVWMSAHDLTPDDTFGGALGLAAPPADSEADDQ
jgi:hypothetical protein